MTITSVEVAWGERLTLAVNRWLKKTGRKWQELAAVCATFEDATRNTYVKLLDMEDPPTGKAARRAHVLLLAIGEDPDSYGLDFERPATWTSDKSIRDLLERAWPWILEEADQAA